MIRSSPGQNMKKHLLVDSGATGASLCLWIWDGRPSYPNRSHPNASMPAFRFRDPHGSWTWTRLEDEVPLPARAWFSGSVLILQGVLCVEDDQEDDPTKDPMVEGLARWKLTWRRWRWIRWILWTRRLTSVYPGSPVDYNVARMV